MPDFNWWNCLKISLTNLIKQQGLRAGLFNSCFLLNTRIFIGQHGKSIKITAKASQELIPAPWWDCIHLQCSQKDSRSVPTILPGILRCWWAAPQSCEWVTCSRDCTLKITSLTGLSASHQHSQGQESCQNQPKLCCDHLWARAH